MKTEIRLTPESEEEVELLESLSEIREYALQEADMDPESVAGIFAQMAAGLCTEAREPAPEYECPECDSPIEDVEAAGLGANPVVQPCGCETSYEELPPELYLEEEI